MSDFLERMVWGLCALIFGPIVAGVAMAFVGEPFKYVGAVALGSCSVLASFALYDHKPPSLLGNVRTALPVAAVGAGFFSYVGNDAPEGAGVTYGIAIGVGCLALTIVAAICYLAGCATDDIVARPPTIEGVSVPGWRYAIRFQWWAQKGYWYGAWHGRLAGRVFSTFMAIMWWPAALLGFAVQACMLIRPAARYYLSPERDAVLAVVTTAGGWSVDDHISKHPGTGRGKALRALVMPELCARADAEQIAIYATAANERLARQYAEELPGLVDVGRGSPRGRRLRREPKPL